MKISFCTTCMGRLFHLKQTLPINLFNTEGCSREFVILDYNSRDGLQDWMKTLTPWIKSGVVKYYQTKIPQNFCAAHAKNIAHKQATGDIVCNLDADNFILPGFCEYLNELFSRPKVLFYSGSRDSVGQQGCCGKIAVLKEHFLNVNGYDEDQKLGWGWDDVSFRYRTKMFNNLDPIQGNMKWNLAIDHGNDIRTQNYIEKDIIKSMEWSRDHLMELTVKNQYVVNLGRPWGEVEDLSMAV